MVRALRFICLISFISPSFSLAVDDSRLWLPQKYQKDYIGLIKSAESAETLERCVTVLEGTIDLDQSQEEHPIFRILCRQPNGHSYNEMVDGLSFDTLTTAKTVIVELTEEALEALRKEQEALKQSKIKALKSTYWKMCRTEVEKSAYLMRGLEWLTIEEPEPSSFVEIEAENCSEGDLIPEVTSVEAAQQVPSDPERCSDFIGEREFSAEAIFAIDFDSKTPNGEKLRYRALCTVKTDEVVKIDMKKR